ncbi:bifunctional phosphoserine phosphatase/phosphoglycerate dehydrogenase [Pontibacter sp. BAB1700]|nr:bifunctional phosphoserine phosphatase/phosphoglycerate dehydrogenase [Pontibacter sp. BAB1700]
MLAEALGMVVYYYDVVERLQLGNARKCETLKQLLQIADIVSLHVDGRTSNQGMFGAEEFAAMKDGGHLF